MSQIEIKCLSQWYGICVLSKASRLVLGLKRSLSSGRSYAFLGVKWSGPELDHAAPSSVEVKNELSYNSTPPIFLHGVHGDKFTFTIKSSYLDR